MSMKTTLIGTALLLSLLPSAAFSKERLLARFSSRTPDAEVRSLLAGSGLKIRRHFPEIGVYALEVKDAKRFKKAEADLRQRAMYVEEDGKVKLDVTPNDPMLGEQVGFRRTRVEKAWNITTGSKKVVVAVSDTGFTADHRDLAHQLWTNPGEIADDGIDNEGNGYIDDVHGWDFLVHNKEIVDRHGHGTHVSGIIGAEGNNAKGVVGMNWNISIMPVRFIGADGGGEDSDAIGTLIYAANNGARVINCSWGGTGYTQALKDAIDYAWSKGTLVIAASGNDSEVVDNKPHYPAGYDTLGVLAVAASEQDGLFAYFSNIGKFKVGLVAPGLRILSTLPYNSYDSWSGTSMAAPMVTGTAGLMLSVRPDLTGLELRNGLLNATRERKNYIDWISSAGDLDTEKAVKQLSAGFQVWPTRHTLEIGKTYPYSAYDAQGEVRWSIAPEDVASIDAKTGVVTALKEGVAQVSATDASGKIATAEWLHVEPGSFAGEGCAPAPKDKLEKLTRAQRASSAFSMSLPLLAGLLVMGRRRRKPAR